MKNFVLKFAVEDSDVNMLEEMWNKVPSARLLFDDLMRKMKVCEMKVESVNNNDVTSFFYYMWNKWCESEAEIVFADSCGGYKHYWNKWVYFCNEYGCRAAVDMLYGELDEGNRNKLVARAIKCYDGMKEKF